MPDRNLITPEAVISTELNSDARAVLDVQIIGPSALKLCISSDTDDADIFVVLRLFTPDLKEITYSGSDDPHTPMAHGWLRASHRKLDATRSLLYRPYHSHDEIQPLKPGNIYDLEIEIWPTCIIAPAGYRLAITIRGRDYVYPGDLKHLTGAIGQPATASARSATLMQSIDRHPSGTVRSACILEQIIPNMSYFLPSASDQNRSLAFFAAYLNKIALWLNQRARITLGFKPQADRLLTVLQ